MESDVGSGLRAAATGQVKLEPGCGGILYTITITSIIAALHVISSM